MPRHPQVGDLVAWGRESYRIRGLILAPVPTVTVARLGAREALRLPPETWATRRWDDGLRLWHLPDPLAAA